jgi:hypothetical protein
LIGAAPGRRAAGCVLSPQSAENRGLRQPNRECDVADDPSGAGHRGEMMAALGIMAARRRRI